VLFTQPGGEVFRKSLFTLLVGLSLYWRFGFTIGAPAQKNGQTIANKQLTVNATGGM
jgi:hypothetical protein